VLKFYRFARLQSSIGIHRRLVTPLLTINVSTFVATCAGELESVAWNVKDTFAAAVGVPLIWPVF